MSENSLVAFLAELESHCSSTAIATFLDSEGQVFVIDLNRHGNSISYGYKVGDEGEFINRLLWRCNPQASLILRSFTAEIDNLTKLPIKELRGYVVKNTNNTLEFEKLSPTMMFACYNTDAETGEPLPLEQSIRYC
jgi:hypothetical protein